MRKQLSIKEVNALLNHNIADYEKETREWARKHGVDEDECWRVCKPVKLKKKDFAKNVGK